MKKSLFGELRKYLVQVFRDLVRSRESEVIKGRLLSPQVYMLISIPQNALEHLIGYGKGKSAICITRNH